AQNALRNAGEEDAIGVRFVRHTRSVAERSAPELLDADHAAALEREVDNLRAAIVSAIRDADAESALRLATAACWRWSFRGCYAEACAWLRRALAAVGPAKPLSRARAAAWLGQLLQLRGEYQEAEQWLSAAVQQQRTIGDALGSALVLAMLGQLV